MRFLSTSQLLVLLELSVLQVVPSVQEEQRQPLQSNTGTQGAAVVWVDLVLEIRTREIVKKKKKKTTAGGGVGVGVLGCWGGG